MTGASAEAQSGYIPTVPVPLVYGHAQAQPYDPPPVTPTKHKCDFGSLSTADLVDLEHGGLQKAEQLHGDLPVSIRHGFIRKVYGILTAQLLVTFGIALVFGLWKAAGAALLRNNWAFYICVVLIFVFLFTLICVPGMAQRFPVNFILFFCISSCFGVTMGFLAAAVSKEAFLMALGITFAVVVALTLFACQTKYDFTGCAPYILIILILLVIFGLCAAIFQTRVLNFLYGGLGAGVFSIFIVIDTQMIVGGKHKKYQYGLDDYVFAALTLYMDILNLFSYIIMLINN